MKLVHEADKPFVEHLANLGPKRGMWIAGGTPLSWYRGEPTNSDIDLFFEDAASYKHMLEALTHYHDSQIRALGSISSLFPFKSTPSRMDGGVSATISRHMETANAITFEAHVTRRDEHGSKRYLVQLIKRRFYEDVHRLLDDFDITVCQIATNLETVHTGPDFAVDVARRRLRLHHVTPSTAKRVIKYWVYGYQPDDAVLERVLSDENQVMEMGNDDY